MTPKLSIVIPVYNAEAFLADCLDSVLNQSFDDIEVICVDDGSTDGSSAILERYRTADPRVMVVRQENAGLSAARNKGMASASGEYLEFLDSDDLLAPESLHAMLRLSDDNCLDQLVFSASLRIERKNISKDEIRHIRDYYALPSDIIGKTLSGRDFLSAFLSERELFCPAPLRLFRRSSLDGKICRFPDGILHEDNYFSFVALLSANRVMAVSDQYYVRRVRAGSIMSSSDLNLRRVPGFLSVLCNLAALRQVDGQGSICELSFARHADDLRKQLGGWRSGFTPEERGKSVEALRDALDRSFVPDFPFVRGIPNHPVISVVIPVFNKDAFLPESLFSVLGQSLEDLEVVCVDDGSTDGSAMMLDWFASKDDRVVVVHQDRNEGVFAARNLALEMARGDFVCFLDPDDWYPGPNVLKRLVESAIASNAEICGGSFSFYENRNIRTDFHGWADEYTFSEEKTIAYSDYQFDFGYHRFVYSRKLLSDRGIRFPPFVRFQDPPFFVQAMISTGRFRAVPDVVYRYRVGHQTVNWTADGCKRGRDCLKGLLSDLELARNNRLEKLFSLTVRRIDRDFAEPLAECAIVDDRFFDSLCSLDPERADSASVDLPTGFSANRIVGPVRLVRQKLVSEISGLRDERDGLRQRLNAMTTSCSYRIGRAATWPFRMFWELVHSLRTQPVSVVWARILSAIRNP